MEPVKFIVEVNKEVETKYMKKALEELADDISIYVDEFKTFRYVLGTTSKKTYERLFKSELEYVEKTIHNINRVSRKVYEWTEIKPAQVPEKLKGKIKSIKLEKKIYITD